MHISTNDLHCCKPARLLQRAPSGGRPRSRPPATAPPRSDPTSPTTTDCAGRRDDVLYLFLQKQKSMAGRQQTAPPQPRRSQHATAHPHQPGAQTPHAPSHPAAAATAQPKPRSGPHYGTEFDQILGRLLQSPRADRSGRRRVSAHAHGVQLSEPARGSV